MNFEGTQTFRQGGNTHSLLAGKQNSTATMEDIVSTSRYHTVCGHLKITTVHLLDINYLHSSHMQNKLPPIQGPKCLIPRQNPSMWDQTWSGLWILFLAV